MFEFCFLDIAAVIIQRSLYNIIEICIYDIEIFHVNFSFIIKP